MSESWSGRVARVVPKPGTVVCTPIEAHALIELAYLAIATDVETNASEEEAWNELSLNLKALVDPEATPLSEMDRGTLLKNLRRRTLPGQEAARVEEVAKNLASEGIREVAYKIAFAMTLIDFVTTEEEIAIDKVFRSSLSLTDDRVKALRDEVYAALEAG
jgi:hypothetical protein